MPRRVKKYPRPRVPMPKPRVGTPHTDRDRSLLRGEAARVRRILLTSPELRKAMPWTAKAKYDRARAAALEALETERPDPRPVVDLADEWAHPDDLAALLPWPTPELVAARAEFRQTLGPVLDELSDAVLYADMAEKEEAWATYEPGWCGSTTGYERHRRRRELACPPCRRAHADDEAERVARRLGAA